MQREIEDLSAKVQESRELFEKEKEVKQQMEADCRRLENNLKSEKVLDVSDVYMLCRNGGSEVFKDGPLLDEAANYSCSNPLDLHVIDYIGSPIPLFGTHFTLNTILSGWQTTKWQ